MYRVRKMFLVPEKINMNSAEVDDLLVLAIARRFLGWDDDWLVGIAGFILTATTLTASPLPWSRRLGWNLLQ
jgi:hypothetical protein